MKRIIDSRATGKSGRLMLLAKEDNGIIVCGNPNAMRDKAYRYGITGIEFISYAEYMHHKVEYTHRKVYIDELEIFINHCCGNLSGYTLSVE